MAPEYHASRIRETVQLLNQRIHEATVEGLDVDLSIHEFNVLSSRLPRPQLDVRVSKEISDDE